MFTVQGLISTPAMKKQILLLGILACFSTQAYNNEQSVSVTNLLSGIDVLTSKMDISKEAVAFAIKGYETLKEKGQLVNSRFLTIADFSKPSSARRLFIIDMERMELVLQTLVAHGRNSGKLFAEKFSNKNQSNQSSLGFYITGDIYNGKHGMSLRLNGIESGINDKASKRAIVLHGADYVSEWTIKKQGYIGRSLGCPAVPQTEVNEIIQTIKGASLLYIYAPNKAYTKQSKLISGLTSLS